MTRLRIAIATAGRFHVLDLARELHGLGHEVRFYSYVPKARAAKFGLPPACHVGLLPFAAPALAWSRLAPRLMPRAREALLYALLNRGAMFRLQPCDVFICMSGIYLEAALYAKQRYGAQVWLHRGSRHILSQDEILQAIPNAERPTPLAIARELAGYALADRIVVQTEHVAESFARDPAACRKLIRNPTGADLTMFPDHGSRPGEGPLRVLMVGNWSLRKGCDLLAEAVRRTEGLRLIHVGPIGDLPFPQAPRFTHLDAVPQWRLREAYGAADIVALASREEGLSQVLIQALASGLPIVCSDRSGGRDLGHTPALKARITEIPHDDLDALIGALQQWRERARNGPWPSPLTEDDRATLGWSAYGRRYAEALAQLARARPLPGGSAASPSQGRAPSRSSS